ncbi:MAG: type VI secretion system-associated protein TagF, partial [Gammaproteobacteria bacterium]|nr:type VI secretion system-associated protein TagF [Gammaproteobacteria bacterium]
MTGFYGKLPGKGDFLTRKLPRQFVDVWDDWLQSGMNATKQVLGDEWLQIYLTSPLWRFVLPPGTCGESAWAGVMMPSMDRVGRYFPMTVAAELALPVSPVMVAISCQPWFESVENSLLEALDNEALDI